MPRQKPTTRREPIIRDGRELMSRMDARFAPETYDAENNTINVSLGRGVPVTRFDWGREEFYIETLSMEPEHWDLERMNAGAPFLADHRSFDLDATIGRFVGGSVRIEDGELVGVVKLAPNLPLDFNFPFLHLDRKFMHLGFHIYDVGFQSPNVEAARPLVYATSFLLVMVIIVLNLSAVMIRNRLRERYKALDN